VIVFGRELDTLRCADWQSLVRLSKSWIVGRKGWCKLLVLVALVVAGTIFFYEEKAIFWPQGKQRE